MKHPFPAATLTLLVTLGGGPVLAADAEHGRELFASCLACHSEQPNALGPSLKGVIGRKSAALEDYRYSNAMKRANLTWDEANLREYIADPQAKVKGNRMPFGGVSKPSDLDDLVAYLKTLK
ncbi:MAG: c-type cytochrome [Xanthobacteraceae bacterium]